MPSILVETNTAISTITLNRPDKHNAFDDRLISDLTKTLLSLDKSDEVRVILLNAAGPNFCAGADLTWMKRMAHFTKEENKADALQLAQLLQTFSTLSKPIIGLIHGHVLGGGIGLVACCDLVIAADNTRFCFSETKLGLIPATIAPYVIRSIGFSATRRYFITAERFDAEEAKQNGLVHYITSESNLLTKGTDLAHQIIKNKPGAIAKTKTLLNHLSPMDSSMIEYTATLLAEVRSSTEAQESIRAFLEKRKPD